MKGNERLHVTITRPMRVALEDLAYRNATNVAVEARRLLRASLDRTIRSPNVQMRLRAEGYTWVDTDILDPAAPREGELSTADG